jgi:hypothetical protein
MEWSYGWEMERIKCRESAIAMSVESFECDSVMYWLIHLGSFARLSARAKRWNKDPRQHSQKEFLISSQNGKMHKEWTDLVGKDHESPVGLSSQDSSDTLGGMSHRVEGEVVGLLDPMRVTQELESGLGKSMGRERSVSRRKS